MAGGSWSCRSFWKKHSQTVWTTNPRVYVPFYHFPLSSSSFQLFCSRRGFWTPHQKIPPEFSRPQQPERREEISQEPASPTAQGSARPGCRSWARAFPSHLGDTSRASCELRTLLPLHTPLPCPFLGVTVETGALSPHLGPWAPSGRLPCCHLPPGLES